MNSPDPFSALVRLRGGEAGVALVVTLLMMSVLVMMVVGLAGVMRNEQAAARNLTFQVSAEQMADLGLRQGMAAVLAGSPAGQPAQTGPGWMQAGTTFRALFSTGAVGNTKNLEEIGTNSLILGLPDNVRGEIRVGWSNIASPGTSIDRPFGRYAYWVDDEGTKVNLNAVGAVNTNLFLPFLTNMPYCADYIFVDPVTGETNTGSAARAKGLASRSNPFATTESVKDTNVTGLTKATEQIGPTVFRRAKGHITAWSSNVDLTPWGTTQLNLADPGLTSAQIKAVLTTTFWTNFSGLNRTLARKYGGGALTAGAAGNAGDIVMDQIVANIRTAAGNVATVSNNPAYSGDTDLFRNRNGLPITAVGLGQSPFLNEVAVSVSSRDITVLDPPQILVTFFFEVEMFNPWPTDSSGYSIELQPRKLRFHIGYNRTPAVFVPTVFPNYGTTWPDSAGANNGITGSAGCWAGPMLEDGSPWPAGTLLSSPAGLVAARSWKTISIRQDFLCVFPSGLSSPPYSMLVDQAYVVIDKIVLKDPSGTIVDWVSLDDFAQNSNYGTSNTTRSGDLGQLNFSQSYPFAGSAYLTAPVDAIASPGPPAAFSAANSLGMAKNDPRVRWPVSVWGATVGTFKASGFPSTLLAWKRASGGGTPNLTLGADNATATGIFDATSTNGVVTGISYLNPDPAPGVTATLNHPHFSEGYAISPPPSGAGFRSVAQLGAIHTGLPWRTLRLQPTSAAELAQGPPDWVLLDAFTATNPSACLPRINLNGLAMAMQGTKPGLVTDARGQAPTRAWSFLSAIGPATYRLPSTNTDFMISNGIPVSLTRSNNSYSNVVAAVGTNLTLVLSNPQSASGWAASSGWGAVRGGRTNFPSNGLAQAGEILEVRGVADDTTKGEDVIEGRLRGFMDLLTTRSDTFSVWSIGQGLVVVTNAAGNPIRTNVMGEVRKQTVFQRVPVFNGVNLTGYQLKVLYTRNHMVE